MEKKISDPMIVGWKLGRHNKTTGDSYSVDIFAKQKFYKKTF